VREQVLKLALEYPDRSSRQAAWLFTVEQCYIISESSVYRIMKDFPEGHRNYMIWWKGRYFE
jgi:hypothetical protein